MKRLLVRMSALATVVVLGLIAIAQAQRGADAPNEFPAGVHANPLRPEEPPAAAVATREIQASGTQRQSLPATVDSAAPLIAQSSDAVPAGGPTAPSGPPDPFQMPISIQANGPNTAVAPPTAIPDNYSAPSSHPSDSSRDPAAAGGLGSPSLVGPGEPGTREPMPSLEPPPNSPPLVGDRYAGPSAAGLGNEPAPLQLDPGTPAGNIPLAPRAGDFASGSHAGMPSAIAAPPPMAGQGPFDGAAADASSAGTGTPGAAALEGAQTPQLTLEKSAPAEIQVGKPAVFRITLRNTGAVAAHDVEIHDEIPRGTRLLTTTPHASRGVRGELVWPIGTIKPGDQVTAEVELMPIDEGEIGSVASVVFAAEASARTTATKPELVIEAAAPGQVLIGEEATLTITISNPGSGVATGVVLQEQVPQGMQHAAGTELEYEVGDLKPNESRQLKLILTAQSPGPATNVLVARADANLKAENQLAIEVIAPQLDVTVDGPKRRYLEREATYELSIGNPGTAPARNVSLVANLPAGMKFVSANNAGYYDEGSRTVKWQLEELPVREQGTVQLTAVPIEMGQQVIQVRASSELGLSVQKELPVLVEGIAAMLFEVVDVDDPIEVGGEATYEIRVLNQGSKAATNVQVAVMLPPEMRAVAAEGPSRYAVEANRVLFEGLARLAPEADTTYRVRVQGLQPGDLRIRVQLTTDEIRTPVTKEELTRVYSDE